MGGGIVAAPRNPKEQIVKVDFSQLILNLDGEPVPVKLKESQPPRPMTLRDAAIEGLCRPTSAPLSGTEIHARFDLADRIKNGGDPVEVSSEDITLLKDLTAVLGVVLGGRSQQLLEAAHSV